MNELVTIDVKNSKYYIFCVCACVCVFRYPAYKAHASYCHLWPVWLSIFFYIIT